MKKLKKIITSVMVLSLGFITSCSSIAGNIEDPTKEAKGALSLDVTQSDLIANFTKNSDYFNSEYVSQIDKLEDSDRIGIIIKSKADAIVDTYFADGEGANLNDYLTEKTVKSAASKMVKSHEAMARKLGDKIEGIKHSYTTLFNGFYTYTTYGQLKDIKEIVGEENVQISEVYAAPVVTSTNDPVENIVDVDENTGIFDSKGVDYDGSNTAVAVLDSGFDYNHEAFSHMPKAEEQLLKRDAIASALDQTQAAKLTNNLRVQDVYINEKVPFSYDYADKDPDVTPFDSEHGTHVSGIIGGGGDSEEDKIRGVAPNTQLVLLKVFSDLSAGAETGDILAALEDTVVIGVDAINMSLGSACGFAVNSDDEYINTVYDNIKKAGISLIVAAGNDYSSGYGAVTGNTSKVTNPDNGVVGSPSTYDAALSVASISGTKSKYVVDQDGYTFFFNESNSLGGKPYDFFEMLNLPTTGDKSLEYVTVPGVGLRVNYSTINVEGKVALVKRGNNTFEEKARLAYENGAAACIIYNNVAGDILMSAGNDLKIPLVSISKDDGEQLAKRASGTLTFNRANLAGPFMSDFSSWGPLPSLGLKPEITAHGGNITSAVPGNLYDSLSGTSMASPNLCGVVVLIREYVKTKFPSYTNVEVNALTYQLLMSTATIALNEVGNPYSPRKQGAGLGDLVKSITTGAYLTVDDTDRTKLELGDDPERKGIYEMNFNLVNMSSSTLSYDISNLTMTESISTSDNEYIAERANMLNPNQQVSVTGGTYASGAVSVAANSTAKIKVTISLTEEEKSAITKSFPNGSYVEGFVTLASKNTDKIDLNIPFLAFFGDWTEAPIFDKTFYEVEADKNNGSIDEEDKTVADYYATTPLGTYFDHYIIPLGSYVYNMDETRYDPISASADKAAIGTGDTTINGITTIYAGLLRSCKTVTYTITETLTGKEIYSYTGHDAWKAHYGGGQIPGYEMLDIAMKDLPVSNNTTYTLTMTGYLDYGDGGVANNISNSFVMNFTVDNEAPIITNVDFRSEYDRTLKDNRYYMDIYVHDNQYAMSVRPFILVDGMIADVLEYPVPVYGEKDSISKVTIEVTDYLDVLSLGSGNNGASISSGFGIMTDDYAMNGGYYFVSLPGADGTLSFSPSSQTMEIGQELDLTTMLTSNDPTFQVDSAVQQYYYSKLNWKSANENVVKVQDGIVEAVGRGTTTVSVSNLVTATGNIPTTSMRITVREPSVAVHNVKRAANFEDFKDIMFTSYETVFAFPDGPEYSRIGDTGDLNPVTPDTKIEFYPGEKIKLDYAMYPFNIDPSQYELEWRSSNNNIVSVEQDGTVSALREGTATVTLRVKNLATGRYSSIMASMRTTVKSEFIVEGSQLTGYKGLGGDVVIPDNLGILYVGPYAFSLYITDDDIPVDEDDWDRNKIPQGNNTITSVTIPGDVIEIQKYAFYNCPNLKKVEILKAPNGDSPNVIREFAFKDCVSLEDINIDDVQIIGASAFENCSSLVLTQEDFKETYALGQNAFRNCDSLTFVDITTVRNTWPYVFADCDNLTSVTMGSKTKLSVGMFMNSGLKSVDVYADRIPVSCFANCVDLTTVKIKNNIVYVGASAFENCVKLNSVVFDGSTEIIETEAFKNCVALASISLPNSAVIIEDGVFSGCTALETVAIQAKTLISNLGSSTFVGCNKLASFTISSDNTNYKTNGSYLMSYDETELILAAPNATYGDVVLPSSITSIASGAFSGITTLTGIETSATNIGSKAFANCTALTSITLKGTDVVIGASAFEGCTALTSFDDSIKVSEFGASSFARTGLTSITISNDVNVLESAFSSNASLATVTLGANVSLGTSAFANCGTLTRVNTSNGLAIGDHAFEGNRRLATFDFTKTTDTIGSYAFFGCSSLGTVNLSNVKYIGDYAFADCNAMRNLTMPVVVEIGDYAFAKVNGSIGTIITSINSNTLTTIGESAFAGCTRLARVNLDSITTIGANAFAGCTALTNVSLGDNITEIAEGTFSGATTLATINLGNIVVIGDSAFANCSKLNDIVVNKVTSIGNNAFANARALTSIALNRTVSIGNNAFNGASALVTVNMPVVETIGQGAFTGTAITSIAIPNTIKNVEIIAFYGAKSLTKITNSAGQDTATINNYAFVDGGVLYTRTANNNIALSCYPASKADATYTVVEGTKYVLAFAGAGNTNITKLVLPNSLKAVGNLAFYGASKLNTVEFRSPTAPILEGDINGDGIRYTTSSPVYVLLNHYYNLNGSDTYKYGQFNNWVGMGVVLSVVLPQNKDVLSGYDGVLYGLYFNMNVASYTGPIVMDQTSLNFLEAYENLPSAGTVTVKDEDVIVATRTYYNALKQDLTQFGYTANEIQQILSKLSVVEAELAKLKRDSLYSKYGDILDKIDELGTVYSFEKLDLYKEILIDLSQLTKSARDEIGTTVIDAFAKSYSEYLKSIEQDIETIDALAEFTTTDVLRSALTVAATGAIAIISAVGLVIIMRRRIGGLSL